MQIIQQPQQRDQVWSRFSGPQVILQVYRGEVAGPARYFAPGAFLEISGNFFVRSRHCVSRRVALSHSSPRAPHVFSICFLSVCISPSVLCTLKIHVGVQTSGKKKQFLERLRGDTRHPVAVAHVTPL